MTREDEQSTPDGPGRFRRRTRAVATRGRKRVVEACGRVRSVAAPGRARSGLTRGRVSVLGTTLVLVIGGVVAVRTVETEQLAASVRSADLLLLAAAACVYALSWPVRGRRYDDILGAMGARCGVVFAAGAVFVSQTANLVVPARAGDGLRAYLLKSHREVPYAKGAASLTVERLFDLLALLVLGGLALSWLVVDGGAGELAGASEFVGPAAVVGSVGTAAFALIVVFARRERGIAGRLRTRIDGPRFRRFVDALLRFWRDLRAVATDPRALGVVGAGSLVIWLLDVLTAVLVLAAVTGPTGMAPLSFLAVGTLAVTVGNLAKVLPLSQGGIGLYEAAFTALVVAVSPVGAGTALAAAVLDHALKNVLTVLGGAVGAMAFNVSLRSPSRERESEPANF